MNFRPSFHTTFPILFDKVFLTNMIEKNWIHCDVFVNFSEINWWLLALKWLPFRHTIKSVKTKVKIPPIYPTKYYLVAGYRYDATKWKWRKVVRRIISSRRVPWGVNCVWIYDVRIIPGRFQVGGGRQIVPPEHTWAITSILTNVFKARQKKRWVNESENWGDGSCVPLSPDKPNITTSDDVYTRLKKRDSWRWPGTFRGNPETYSFTMQYCNSSTSGQSAWAP